MNNPLVTVYITNYNYERFIEQSIQSVFSQSLISWEIIILDDGSTDNSRDILEKYREEEKVTIIYQQNKGLNITNNVAMRVAKGKYLMRLDADDFLHPLALEKMVAPLEADPNLGLVFPDYYYADAEGEIIAEERRHNFEKEVSLYDQPAHGACTMIRLSFLKKVGGYNESFTCQDGYDLWLKFITHYSVSNVNESLFYYRRHGANLTTNEERILNTRREIKKTFLDMESLENSSILIIPLRNQMLNGFSLALDKLYGESLLEKKIDAALKASVVSKVYVISEDFEVKAFCEERYAEEDRLDFILRPKSHAGPNQSLGATVQLAYNHAVESGLPFTYLLSAAIDFPFVESEVFDDAVNTIALFKSDAVLTVRPDNKTYYQHTGHQLKPILDQDKFTRLEREALYRGSAGVMACTRKSFERNGTINAGAISHVVVDEKTAFGIHSEFDFRIYKALMAERLVIEKVDN